MKAQRRKFVITFLGALQVLFGIFLVIVGIWALAECQAPVGKTGAVPFWIAGLCLLTGYIALSFPRNCSKKWIYLLICASIISCIVSAVVTSWMFVMLLRASNYAERIYFSLVMSCNIFLMLNTAVLAVVGRAEADISSFNSSTTTRRSASFMDHPPPYTNVAFQFGNIDFSLPAPGLDAPPPYEP